ncbi:acetoacetate decarboxylase family protein [Desmonostoc muscorum LEGE 12446]|uniref:Uncharacterized protein n=1 Tax=Desmonostoc muscorum LEGE 12446 TaxID=1828758 RepID=A0A8J7A7L9_DESMC|nr:hypothetical protein [Desmonostoc muscorum]MCF2151402.1 acetoacetate decarboxylase family protein [Desmonostoc muscorum LEGE 12446]
MNYPLYIERGGEQVPYYGRSRHENVQVHGFWLKADIEALQQMCDRYLNISGDGELEYRPVTSAVLLAFSDMGAVYPLDVERPLGWIPEIDIAFWVPVVAVKRIAGVAIPQRLVWFMPYLWVDSSYAMAGGREVFGFHKSIGQFQLPKITEPIQQLTVDTIGLKQFAPDTRAEWHRLVEVRRVDSGTDNPHQHDWHTIEDASQYLEQLMIRSIVGKAGSFWEGLVKVLNLASLKTVPIVFLKQFRDIQDPRRACYQAIAEASAKIMNFQSGGQIEGNYELVLHHLDSHPIAQELGLKNGRQTIEAAYWMQYDFIMETGQVVWQSSGVGNLTEHNGNAKTGVKWLSWFSLNSSVL